MSTRSKIALVYGCAILVAIWSFFPIYQMINWSLMLEGELIEIPQHLYPHSPTLYNYLVLTGLSQLREVGHLGEEAGSALYGPEAFRSYFLPAYMNSLLVAISSSVAVMLVAMLSGYAFARFKFAHKGKLLFAFFFTRILPPIVIMIPYYYIMSQVHLVGTTYSLIISYLSAIVPLVSWILIGYFGTLPVEPIRAARVDGCGRLGVLRHIILPMAMPGVAITFILAFLMAWNEFVFALVLVGGTSASTIPPILSGMFQYISEFSVMSTAVMLGLLPPVILVIFLSRYITRINIVDPLTVEAE